MLDNNHRGGRVYHRDILKTIKNQLLLSFFIVPNKTQHFALGNITRSFVSHKIQLSYFTGEVEVKGVRLSHRLTHRYTRCLRMISTDKLIFKSIKQFMSYLTYLTSP